MFKIRLLIFIFAISISQVAAVTMTWDNSELGTGLHVHYQGTNWIVRETRAEDIEFYKTLHGDTNIMRTMESGNTLPEEVTANRVDAWVKRFSEGFPTGRMIIEQDEKPIGVVHLCPNGVPGVGEFAFALVPEAQGQGLGKAALEFIVKEWAPAIRKQGLGEGINKPHPTVEKFKCFGGEPLSLIYATVRPSNLYSLKCFNHFNFYPSKPVDETYQINCQGWEETSQEPLEDYIVKLHFSEKSSNRLQSDVLYSMVDKEGKNRTLSFVDKYKSLRYHLERKVE